MEKEFNYYLFHPLSHQHYPTLVASKNGKYEFEHAYIENPSPMEYEFHNMDMKKSITYLEMVDCHNTMGGRVISKRVYELLKEKNLLNTQYIPASGSGKKDIKYTDYYFLNNFNFLSVINREESMISWHDKKEKTRMTSAAKLVLDIEKLNSLPYEQTQLFRLSENHTKWFIHKDLMKEILSLEPKGFAFIPAKLKRDVWYFA